MIGADLGGRLRFGAMLAAAVLLPTLGLYAGGSYMLVVGAVSLALLAAARWRLRPDAWLVGIVAAYLALCWLAIAWSIVPAATAAAALAMSALALVLAPMVSAPVADLGGRDLDLVLDTLVVAIMAGAVLAGIDMIIYNCYGSDAAPFHYTDHRVVKYNRGVSYLDMMLWPVLAYYWRHRSPALALGVTAAVTMVTLVSASTTAKLALLSGFAVLAASLVSAAGTLALLAVAVAVLGLTMPLIVKGASTLLLGQSLPLLKVSGLHRLEFWDYMADRVWERPVLGWGLQSAPNLPIGPEELARYHVVTAEGIGHEHNLWLQVWVETGAVGAVLFLAFALFGLRRAATVPAPLRPFALAGYATVLVMTLSAYNFSADSWWAALAWSAFLFTAISKTPPFRTQV